MTNDTVTQKGTLHKAERRQAKLRIGVFGASGSGKTMSALKLAHGMAPWEKIAIIDTENGSADLYSHLGPYNVLTLATPFNPEKYIEAIKTCEDAGMEVIIVDSITHEWAGEGGILDEADRLGKTAKNAFTIWGQLTPRHNKFISKILFANSHVIACGRSKVDYALNEIEKNGKKVSVPEKIGLKAITREGFDYEMTISFDLDITHYAISTKDRTGLFQDKAPSIIDEKTGTQLAEWNQNGAVNPDEQKREIARQFKRLGVAFTKDNIGEVVKLNTGLDLEEKNFEAIIAGLTALQVGEGKLPIPPVDPARLTMLRGLTNKRLGLIKDEQILVYLDKFHGLKLERLTDLTNEQVNKVNDELLMEPAPATETPAESAPPTTAAPETVTDEWAGENSNA